MRAAALAAVLLLAASYLVFGAWWQGQNASDTSPGPLKTGDTAGPELTGRATPTTPVDTTVAEALHAALIGKGPKEQRRIFLDRSLAGTAPVPYYEPLARHLIELLLGKERGALWYYSFSCLVSMGQPVAPLFESQVDSEDGDARRLALAVLIALRREGVAVSLPPMLDLIEDADAYVRQLAWGLLYRGVPYEDALAQRMLGHMQRNPAPGQWSAGTALAQMGPKGVALLLGELKAADARRRLAAARSIGQAPLDEIRAVFAELMLAMEDPAPDVREWAIRALSRFEGDCAACLPALLKTAQESDFGIVQASLRILGEMGPAAEAAVPLLLERLQDDDPRLVSQAAGVLGAIHARAAVVLPALAALVREDTSDAAARAIGAFGPEGWEYAVALLHDDDEDVRYSGLTAFQAMGASAAPIVPELLPLIRGDDHSMALRAIETAGAIGPGAKGAIPAILERLAWGEEDLPVKVAGPALVRLGPAAEGPLRQALRSSDHQTRSQAVRVVAFFLGRAQFAFPELETLLTDKDATVRLHAVYAAGAVLQQPVDLAVRLAAPRTAPGAHLELAVRKRLRSLLERAREDEDETVRRQSEAYLRTLDAT